MTATQPHARSKALQTAAAALSDDSALIDAWQRWLALHWKISAFMDRHSSTLELEQKGFPTLVVMQNRHTRIEWEIEELLPPRTREGAAQVAALAHQYLAWHRWGLSDANDFLTGTVLSCMCVLADLPVV